MSFNPKLNIIEETGYFRCKNESFRGENHVELCPGVSKVSILVLMFLFQTHLPTFGIEQEPMSQSQFQIRFYITLNFSK